MKNNALRLFGLIGDIDNGIVNEALLHKGKSKIALKCLAIAACAVFIAGIGAITYQPELPIIEHTGEFSVGMGFEGYMAYDISELVNANPVEVGNIPDKLPVYKNKISYSYPHHIAQGVDMDAMRSLLVEYAGKLGITEYEITTNEYTEEQKNKIAERLLNSGLEAIPEGYFDPTEVIIETDKLTLRVDMNLGITITYNEGLELPEEYNFGFYSSYEEMCKVGEYLISEYEYLLDMSKPTVNVYGGDRNVYSEQRYHITVFDGKGSNTNKLLNYNFKTVSFNCNDDGELWIIRIDSIINGDKLGNYPIINYEKACELLYNGSYITTVMDYTVTDSSIIEKAELIYRCGASEEYFIPYYRFYIDIDKDVEGMNTYGAFYVPAVAPEYLSYVEVWDGSFN